VVGSNAFNLLGILGVAALARPIARGSVGPVDFGVMLGFALLMLPVMRTGYRISRLEGGFLVAGYLGYLWWLMP
jgi:cation:H+ antiporter